jgi:hypothetical protein
MRAPAAAVNGCPAETAPFMAGPFVPITVGRASLTQSSPFLN